MSAVRPDRPPVPRLALFFALLGGAVAWTVHLLASYPLVPPSCEMGSNAVLNIITAATALMSAVAALVGWWAYRRLGGSQAEGTRPGEGAIDERMGGAGFPGDDPPFAWARFMALCGAVLSAFFVFVIIVEGLPPLLQDPCLENL